MGALFEGFNQFINWVPKLKENGKVDKVPLDQHNWMSFEDANARAAMIGAGVGFVFTEADPFFFVDIDNALEGDSWSPLAQLILSAFPGCAVEISYSGTGLHIFGMGASPGHSCTNKAEGLEFYTEGRFVALTGKGSIGSTQTNGQIGVDWLVSNYFAGNALVVSGDWTDAPVAEWCGPEDDEELVKRAKRSKSVAATFGGKARFIDLYQGNVEKLSDFYPTTNGVDPYGYSEADAALCSHLAFFTGKNCERIERIFNTSALGQRDKWIGREDYRKRTILGAVSVCKSVYNVPPPPDPIGGLPVPESAPPVEEAGVPIGVRTGNQFLDLHNQLEYFKGCVYVISKHRVFVPGNGLLKPDQFRATYGGYDFAVNWSGKPTKNAFETFTESQLYMFPKAFGTCFRPEETPGSSVKEEGLEYVNTYFPVEVDRRPGDVTPFLDLLGKILPDERDRTILLSYMAACVQHVGTKFQWAPLLQGAPGNGKTFFMTAISKAVGERYSHFPSASDLKGNGLKFTAWLYEKLFIGIEDLFPDGKTEVQDAINDKITNRRIEFQAKGGGQFMGDNRANFLFAVNPKDAILKTEADRRYCIFFTAQQSSTDINRCGMGGTYFPDLYNWARAEGFAYFTDYLFNYRIAEEFNPAGACHRAPVTTSTNEALSLSVGSIAQEVLEAVAEGRVGFRGGWISSVALDILLSEKRKPVALNKRPELLEGLGYVRKERLNNPSVIDGGKKAILYVENKPELINIAPGAATAMVYTKAQQDPQGLHAVG